MAPGRAAGGKTILRHEIIMSKTNILEQIEQKGSEKEKIAAQVVENPGLIPELLEGLKTQKGSIKFGCEKVLRLVSEQKPALIYPHFDIFAALLDSENNFLKWGAIKTTANLTPADSENKFEKIFAKYYALVTGPDMVTAANIVAGSVIIARAKPKLVEKISREILKVENAEYIHQGVLSEECQHVAFGHAIDAFTKFFDKIEEKQPVIEFIKKQLNNFRKPVAIRAEKFFKKYKL